MLWLWTVATENYSYFWVDNPVDLGMKVAKIFLPS